MSGNLLSLFKFLLFTKNKDAEGSKSKTLCSSFEELLCATSVAFCLAPNTQYCSLLEHV